MELLSRIYFIISPSHKIKQPLSTQTDTLPNECLKGERAPWLSQHKALTPYNENISLNPLRQDAFDHPSSPLNGWLCEIRIGMIMISPSHAQSLVRVTFTPCLSAFTPELVLVGSRRSINIKGAVCEAPFTNDCVGR